MKQIKDLSIKSKITWVIMSTSCIALLIACTAFIGHELLTFRQAMVLELSTLADVIGQFSSPSLRVGMPIGAENALAPLRAEKQILAACLYKDGKIWAKFPKDQPDTSFPESVARESHRFANGALMLTRPVLDPDNNLLGIIFLQSSLDATYNRLRRDVGIVLTVLLAASIVALLLSSKLQTVISKPILQLSQTARVVSENRDYSLRASRQSRDEVGVLIDSFNEMLAQIQKHDSELQAARDQANRANQAKSNFLSFMSHELRTPLTAIIGFSEMLLSSAEAESRAEWADDLRRINDSGKYLLELINDILDLSKIEAGKMEVHIERFEVAGLLRDVTEALRPLVTQKSNQLVIEAVNLSATGARSGESLAQLGTMHSDMIKVRQCLLNLLSNANKFTDHGKVTIAVSRMVKEGTDWLIFRVKDTGIGLSPAQMSKLFRAFSQADNSTARRYGGSGLGLALTKQFCQMLGGNVSAESEPGKGSCFTIELPARAPSQAVGLALPAPEPSAAHAKGSANCILVIDDDPGIHRLIAAALREEDYNLQFASSGAEGLRLARELRPAVITLDVLMPQMDGWVVLSLLKADPELAGIPVIMLSVRADENFAFAMGVADYLKKPIDRERLIAVLKKYHRLEPPIQVLVVEDDSNMRQMLRRMLEQESWAVCEAPNGQAALECVARAQPSLIILDMLMPVMDGFQMVAELQKHEDWRKIPVVVVSAKELTQEDRVRLQGCVTTILEKGSFSRDELMREVQQTVREFMAVK
jgi:signal transduction histidine kinase/CheY-like chemotaxis protein